MCRLVVVSIDVVYPEARIQPCVGGDTGPNEHGTAACREHSKLKQFELLTQSSTPTPSLCGSCLVLQIKEHPKVVWVGVPKELVDNGALVPVEKVRC